MTSIFGSARTSGSGLVAYASCYPSPEASGETSLAGWSVIRGLAVPDSRVSDFVLAASSDFLEAESVDICTEFRGCSAAELPWVVESDSVDALEAYDPAWTAVSELYDADSAEFSVVWDCASADVSVVSERCAVVSELPSYVGPSSTLPSTTFPSSLLPVVKSPSVPYIAKTCSSTITFSSRHTRTTNVQPCPLSLPRTDGHS